MSRGSVPNSFAEAAGLVPMQELFAEISDEAFEPAADEFGFVNIQDAGNLAVKEI